MAAIAVFPDFRIVSGATTHELLLADDGARVRYWNSGVDKQWVVGWTVPSLYTSVREGMNGARRGFGLPNWFWYVGWVNDTMMDVLRTELFPNGILTNESVTVQTPVVSWAGGTGLKTFHASVSWVSVFRPEITPVSGGRFSNYALQFFNATYVAPVEA